MFKSKTTYQMRIDSPCTENWDEMLSDTQGKFCLQCQKSVIDFTQKSDAEIIDILKDASSSSCGRMTKAQEQRVFIEHHTSKTKNLFYKIAAGLFFIGGAANAQTNKTETIQQPIDKSTDSTEDKKPTIICGTVKNAKGEPIPQISVQLKGSDIKTITDVDGNFELDISKYKNLNVLILTGYDNYKQEIKVKNYNEKINVVLSDPTKNIDYDHHVTAGPIIEKRSYTGPLGKLYKNSISNKKTKKWYQFWKKN